MKNIHVVLKVTIGAALDNDILKSDPMRKLKMKKPPAPEIHPLDDEQLKMYLAAVECDTLAPILESIIFTGLRESEALGLTRDCVNFKTGKVTIRQQLQDMRKENGGMQMKNDRIRILTLAPYVMELLKEQKIRQFELKLEAGSAWVG